MAISSHFPFAKEAAMHATSNNHPTSNGHPTTKASRAHIMNGHKRAATMPTNTTIDTSHDNIDNTAEFAGDVNTDNEIPSQEVLKRVENMTVLDKDGKTVPFKNLYTGPNVARRVLIIFIRHFFCGNCQEYLRTLTLSISPSSLLSLPTPTFIAVIGCGSPSLIPMYATATSCPFPIYADPTKNLYSALGMLRTLNLGPRPEYQRRGVVLGMLQSAMQSLKMLKGGMAFQGGDYQQVGGEFLFEPVERGTPICSPADDPNDENKQLGAAAANAVNGNGRGAGEEDKRITWCHRMRNTRDHAEIPELREILGLGGEGVPGKDLKAWKRALVERKGTGFSEYARTSCSTTREKSLGSAWEAGCSVEKEKEREGNGCAV